MKGAFIRKDYSLPDLVNYYGKETPLRVFFWHFLRLSKYEEAMSMNWLGLIKSTSR
jgi:hypothetical protein